ncbi:hypothetical protein E4U17_003677 [Claviceps sp. LM77 group G4]|nr:hypothetical protein E4U17_003677 [Claviceps sp. LM77 group G4]KAG6071397.1 hypothetical protein E4U33_003729 [Claviceps sp. LM78 group G4]KAG6074205.1 hypothetical protein E4U16_004126 [Claviceps sp. LM84 group G4]
MGSRLARRRPDQDVLCPMITADRFEVSREDDDDGGEAAMHAEYNNPPYETGTDSRRHNQQLSVEKPKAKPATRQGLAASAPRSGGISKGRIRGSPSA